MNTLHDGVKAVVDKHCRKGNWVFACTEENKDKLYICDFCGSFARVKDEKDLPKRCSWCNQRNKGITSLNEYLKKF